MFLSSIIKGNDNVLWIFDDIVKRLRSYTCIDAVILFGSRARGDHESRSDIDIAIRCPTATDEEWNEIYRAIDNTDTLYFIDIVRLDTTQDTFRNHILKEGKILYESGKN